MWSINFSNFERTRMQPAVHWDRLCIVPLHCASSAGDNDTILVLLKAGAHSTKQALVWSNSIFRFGTGQISLPGSSWECAPLYLAARDNHVSAVSTLVENGASVNTTIRIWRTEYHSEISYDEDHASSKLRVYSPLMSAARNGHADMCRVTSSTWRRHRCTGQRGIHSSNTCSERCTSTILEGTD